jgi:hypothetical protein
MADIEVKNFDKPDETRKFEGKGYGDFVMVTGRAVGRGHFEPGWRWSTNVKPIAGTDLCEVAHLGYCAEGQMRVHMSDGSERDIGQGDVFAIPPGHDAEVLGDQACVLLDFGEVSGYAKQK